MTASLAPSDTATCQRCGTTRRINTSRTIDLCIDCKTTERRIHEGEPFTGTWVRRGLIHIPIPDNTPPPRFGRPRTSPCITCGQVCRGIRCRDCNNARNRSTSRKEQNKLLRMAARRMSPEDLAWCERQERAHFWTVFERANRAGAGDRLVDEARKRVAA